MSRKAIAVLVFVGLLMTFSHLRADILKNKNDGTIVAIGRFIRANDSTIYWENCGGNGATFAPRKEYLYKLGDKDCSKKSDVGMIGNSGGSGTAAGSSNTDVGWREIPVTDPPQTLGPR